MSVLLLFFDFCYRALVVGQLQVASANNINSTFFFFFVLHLHKQSAEPPVAAASVSAVIDGSDLFARAPMRVCVTGTAWRDFATITGLFTSFFGSTAIHAIRRGGQHRVCDSVSDCGGTHAGTRPADSSCAAGHSAHG